MRNSSIGLSAAAPTVESSTSSAPAALAASIRLALPSRSMLASALPARVVESVHGRHDDIDTGARGSEAGAIAHVAGGHRDLASRPRLGARGIAGEDPHVMPAAG